MKKKKILLITIPVIVILIILFLILLFKPNNLCKLKKFSLNGNKVSYKIKCNGSAKFISSRYVYLDTDDNKKYELGNKLNGNFKINKNEKKFRFLYFYENDTADDIITEYKDVTIK